MLLLYGRGPCTKPKHTGSYRMAGFANALTTTLLRNTSRWSNPPSNRRYKPTNFRHQQRISFRTSLVHSAEQQAATRAGIYPCQHPRCRTCGHISSDTDLLGPKDRLTIKDSFTCLSSSLIYCISCRRCPVIRDLQIRLRLRARLLSARGLGLSCRRHGCCRRQLETKIFQ